MRVLLIIIQLVAIAVSIWSAIADRKKEMAAKKTEAARAAKAKKNENEEGTPVNP